MKPGRGVTETVPVIESRILTLRGLKVILDRDLAAIYGVTTKALNQAVKRNASRFPADFVFRLTSAEKAEVVTNCDHLKRLKFSPVRPRAFTEHGAPMAANVLKSPQAVRPLQSEICDPQSSEAWTPPEPPEKPRRQIGFHVEPGD